MIQAPIQDNLTINNLLTPSWVNWFSVLLTEEEWRIDPVLNGVSGDYTTSGFFIKVGDLVSYTVTVTVNSGSITYAATDYIDNLPFEALDYGKQELFDLGDNLSKGSALILKDTRNGYLISHSSSNDIVIIGDYIAK